MPVQCAHCLILFFSLVNVLEALLIGLNSPWINQVIVYVKLTMGGPLHVNGHQAIYRESIKTINKPVIPERLYDAAAILQTVKEDIGGYNKDSSIVALPPTGLLPSRRFPWDSTKHIYALSGYHSLHSVQNIYQTLLKLSGDEPLSGHALHSLVVLWEDSLCTADMTPRSVADNLLFNNTAVAEAGQMRDSPYQEKRKEQRV
ncbi:hypothetical protein UA08_08886 [Talaromyces atroroseus]|uniref:Uncharacterized protein n=1 Tax=Talaromyces atroroseus TaxID=1441469 RepID=A0A225ALR2_TALAT|nr:hypothetical protein UA08_08886 [Talaromyces atroroseus]OKL55856.1 hypothetical protein UA08_08886 [Talaromyces atroroseus]